MKIFRYLVLSGVLGSGAILLYIDLASFLFKAATFNQTAQSLLWTNIFLKLIIAFFLVGFAQLVLRIEKLSGLAGSIPNIVTSLGVLGTFVGIFMGLYNFDVHNLKQSVPLLLEGMKLAFSTSIAGMTSSTLLKLGHAIVISISDGPDPFAPPPSVYDRNLILNDWLATLVSLKKSAFDDLVKRMREIRNAAGSEEIEELLKNLMELKEELNKK